MRQPTNEEFDTAMRDEGERYLERRKKERWYAFSDEEITSLWCGSLVEDQDATDVERTLRDELAAEMDRRAKASAA